MSLEFTKAPALNIEPQNIEAAKAFIAVVRDNPGLYLEFAKSADFYDKFISDLTIDLKYSFKDIYNFCVRQIDHLGIFGLCASRQRALDLTEDTLLHHLNIVLCRLMRCPDKKEQDLKLTLELFLKHWLEDVQSCPVSAEDFASHLKRYLYDLGLVSLLGNNPHSNLTTADQMIDNFIAGWERDDHITLALEIDKAFFKALSVYLFRMVIIKGKKSPRW